jgi:protein-S-isoprenylcysteine O-methyltransferase Ste14
MMTLRMGVLSVISTGAFLAIAMAAEGGWHAFVAKPALDALAGITGALVVASLFTDASLDSGVQEDRSNRWVIAAIMVIGLLAAWLPAHADQKNFGTIGGHAVRWAGVVLYGFGGALRLWPVFCLRNRFSGLVAIQNGHRLLTTGIYAVIRHPSYLGLLVLMLGWALVFRSLIGVMLAALCIIPIIGRIHAEEALLAKTFGPEYAAYRERTYRLIPGIY